MLFRFLAVVLVLMLTSAVSCQAQGMCGEWVEARELKGRSVHALVATRGGIFAATDQGVFRSDDGGLMWCSTNLRVSTYALAYTEDGALLAGTESGVYRSNDYGETWALIGLKGKRVNALASSGAVIYAGTSEGVYATADGAAWRHAGLYGDVVSLAVQPGNPMVVYAGTARGFGIEELGDLYYSTDGGISWSRCWFGNATVLITFLTSTPLVMLLTGVPLIGCVPLYYKVTSVLVNPCDPREVYVGTSLFFTCLTLLLPFAIGDVKLSRDFGSSWTSLGLQLDLKKINTLALGFGCEWLLAGTDDGVFLSTNKGGTWYKLGPENATVQAIAVDSEGRIYAGRDDGLSVFYRNPSTTSLSVSALMGEEGSLRVSGVLASGDVRLSGRDVRILVNGREAAVCRTNFTGGYECAVSPATGEGLTLNLTAYFPGELCYMSSSKTLILHMVSVTTGDAKVSGIDLYGTGWYSPGSIIRVSALPVVEAPPGMRYVFKWWKIEKPTGIETLATTSLELTVDAPTNLTAVYTKQFLVEVVTTYACARSLVNGGGWYDEGSEAVLRVREMEVYFAGNRTMESCVGSGCSRTLFEGWYKDGSPVSREPDIVITPMNEPVKLEARWKIQHYVSAITEHSSVEGEGWYDEGGYATIKLAATEVDAGFVTYHFEGWEGLEARDIVVERGLVRVLVDKPRNLIATWRADYMRIYLLIGLLLTIAAAAVFKLKARKVAHAEGAPIVPPK
jgi:photosystem II stability/assembly factor-like uncharacterized protein